LNLPNAITIARIAVAPALAVLALVPVWPLRLLAFVLFVVAAATDYVDGKLARDRGLVTDLGRLLDPLADQVLLVASLAPMYVLQGSGFDGNAPGVGLSLLPARWREAEPFITPFGAVGLPLWVLVLVLGRELFMTAFRQAAARRGVVIGAIGAAKLKTGFQWTWIGTAFFWFAAARAATVYGWSGPLWHAAAVFIGTVGVGAMAGAVSLTVYSLVLYLHRYGGLFAHRTDHHRG
jgi:phosphatidylglycerophosphate synthase